MSNALLELLDFIRDPENTQLHDERIKAIHSYIFLKLIRSL